MKLVTQLPIILNYVRECNMEIEIIKDLVNNMGFPIAITIFLLWQNRETVKHYEKLFLAFKQSLDANTKALTNLINEVKK